MRAGDTGWLKESLCDSLSKRYIQSIILFLLLFSPVIVSGQSTAEISSFGTDLGGTLIGPISNPVSSQYHFFANHRLSGPLSGEANLGLVFLTDDLRKSRMSSLDYRVLYPMQSLIKFELPSNRLWPYFYAGLGVAKYQLLNVEVQNDPLLRESETKIPNTSIWDNGSGWSLQIPLGIGIDYQLNEDVALRLNAGYHLANKSVIRDDSDFEGYLGATIGMKFAPKRTAPKPTRYPRITISNVIYPKKIENDFDGFAPSELPKPPASRVLVYRIFPPVQYQTLKFELEEYDVTALQDVLRTLKADADLKVKVTGYADPRGSSVMNQSLSNARAWEITQYLLDNGIEISRINIVGLGEEQLSVKEDSVDVLAKSRRSEIQLTYSLPEAEQVEFSDLPEVTDSAAKIQIPPSAIEFAPYSDLLSHESRRWLLALSDYLKVNESAAIEILGMTDSNGSDDVNRMLRQARVASVTRFLLQNGVPFDRLNLKHETGNTDGRQVRIRQITQ